MKNDSDIVKALAHDIANKITKKTIFSLQRMPYDSPLSGDDSGLTTVWDEICVQVQIGESYHWDIYDITVKSFVEYDVSQLKHFEKLALWIQSDSYCDCDKQDDEEFPPLYEGDLVDYLLEEYIYPKM